MNKTCIELIQTIQYNCHLADAQYAADYTLCVYLLKMREFYRWEQGHDYQQCLTNDDVGDWLVEREALWDELEDKELKPLSIDGVQVDAFDTKVINQYLLPLGLLYSASFGKQGRPHFVLADYQQTLQYQGYRVWLSETEYARDMVSPAAMVEGDTLYIRRSAFRQLLWEKVNEWQEMPVDNALGRAIGYYDFEDNSDTALTAMLEGEIAYLIAHEVGKRMLALQLGNTWHTLLKGLPRLRTEIMLYAINDYLADTLSTLPQLINDNHPASIHFYFANLSAMHKKLAPRLLTAYQQWQEQADIALLQQHIQPLQAHWLAITQSCLAFYNDTDVDQAVIEIEALIDQHPY